MAQDRLREEEEEEVEAGSSKAGAKRKSSDDTFDNLVRKLNALAAIVLRLKRKLNFSLKRSFMLVLSEFVGINVKFGRTLSHYRKNILH